MTKFLMILFKLIVCHLIGDYVLQSDFIAKTKGKNFYHMIVHCVLYIVPFIYVGVNDFYTLLFIFGTHLEIDFSGHFYKVSETSYGYIVDQIMHYFVLICVAIYMIG